MFDREGNLRPEAEGGTPPAAAVPEAPGAPPRATESAATAEGSGRTAAAPSQERPSETPSPSAPPPPDRGPGPATPADRVPESALQAEMERDAARSSELDPTGRSTGELPRDFAAFIESQYYEGLLFLGAMRHPATGQVVEDLDMARYKIDVLGMMQDKTEGNRTPEESQLLDDVLYQLRMAYLQKRKVTNL